MRFALCASFVLLRAAARGDSEIRRSTFIVVLCVPRLCNSFLTKIDDNSTA